MCAVVERMEEGRTRVVWLDEPTVLPDWFVEEAGRICDLTVYRDTPDPEEAVRRLSGADIALVEWSRFDAELIARLDTVRYLCIVTTGVDAVDLGAAAAHGVTVTNCPTYSAVAVAEYTIGALISGDRNLRGSHSESEAGRGHIYGPFLARGLAGHTLGLVGLGAIGREVAARASSMGMRVIGCNSTGNPVPGVEVMSLEEVLSRADYVSVQVPYQASTQGLLSAELLGLMPPHAVLTSISRAGVLEEEALAAMLRANRLRGAVLDDVTDPATSPLVNLPSAMATTGIAWFTEDAVERNFHELLETMRSCMGGEPVNRCRPS